MGIIKDTGRSGGKKIRYTFKEHCKITEMHNKDIAANIIAKEVTKIADNERTVPSIRVQIKQLRESTDFNSLEELADWHVKRGTYDGSDKKKRKISQDIVKQRSAPKVVAKYSNLKKKTSKEEDLKDDFDNFSEDETIYVDNCNESEAIVDSDLEIEDLDDIKDQYAEEHEDEDLSLFDNIFDEDEDN